MRNCDVIWVDVIHIQPTIFILIDDCPLYHHIHSSFLARMTDPTFIESIEIYQTINHMCIGYPTSYTIPPVYGCDTLVANHNVLKAKYDLSDVSKNVDEDQIDSIIQYGTQMKKVLDSIPPEPSIEDQCDALVQFYRFEQQNYDKRLFSELTLEGEKYLEFSHKAAVRTLKINVKFPDTQKVIQYCKLSNEWIAHAQANFCGNPKVDLTLDDETSSTDSTECVADATSESVASVIDEIAACLKENSDLELKMIPSETNHGEHSRLVYVIGYKSDERFDGILVNNGYFFHRQPEITLIKGTSCVYDRDLGYEHARVFKDHHALCEEIVRLAVNPTNEIDSTSEDDED